MYTSRRWDTLRFEIVYPPAKVTGSLYKNIRVLDQRADTGSLGTIVTNTEFDQLILPKHPLEEQMGNMMAAITDSTANDGKLLLQLTRFNFTPLVAGNVHDGFSIVRAYLYTETIKGDQKGYQMVDILDTMIVIRYGTIFSSSIKKRLFAGWSGILSDFIRKNLVASSRFKEAFNINEVSNIEEIMKSRTVLYTVDSFTNGIYKTFGAFRKQKPDYTSFMANLEDGNIQGVHVLLPGERSANLDAKDMYAIVYNRNPYIATPWGYYLLVKKDNDFFFTARFSGPLSKGAEIGWSTALALANATGKFFLPFIIVPLPKRNYEMKLDALDGGYSIVKGPGD
jgi:hypothetical protein